MAGAVPVHLEGRHAARETVSALKDGEIFGGYGLAGANEGDSEQGEANLDERVQPARAKPIRRRPKRAPFRRRG